MKKKKLIIIICVVVVFAAIVAGSIYSSRQKQVLVETEKVKVQKEMIAKVQATGEIKPKEYVEIQAEITGVITELYVEEGDQVEKGDILLKIDPMQTRTETLAQEAYLASTEADSRNQQGQIRIQESNVKRDEASLKSTKVEVSNSRENLNLSEKSFARKQQQFEDNLISRDDYEVARKELILAQGNVNSAEAQLNLAASQLESSIVTLEQARESYESSLQRVEQQKAVLNRHKDLLAKTTIRAPLTGVITKMNVEAGERAVPGTLNNPSATLMEIADLSIIEAEVEVDETDIVDLELNQKAEVSVDALKDQILEGIVTEIGNSAIETITEEAKDFKVVIQLNEPPAILRPGLSCTGKITTAVRSQTLSIPIKALTIREYPVDEDGNLIRSEDKNGKDKKDDGAPADDPEQEKKEFEGVYKIVDGKALFSPVETGIISETLIEITSGLEADEEIISGSFKVLRTLKDNDPVKQE
jgi:HlyD family secretion protein